MEAGRVRVLGRQVGAGLVAFVAGACAGPNATEVAAEASIPPVEGPWLETGNGARAIRVRVDPRVELMSILARLAGYEEYRRAHDYDYVRAVDAHFAPYRGHEAVRHLRRMRVTRGLGFDAVASMAVHMSDPPQLAARGTWRGEGRSLERRWPKRTSRSFLEEARDFARVSDFEGFLAQHADLHDATARRLVALLEQEDLLGWFDAFFGIPADTEFYAVPGLLTGGSSYACAAREGAERRVYQVLNVHGVDEKGIPTFDEAALRTAVHEFSHAFVNPLVDAFADELEGPCRALFSHVEEAMKRQDYPSWRFMAYESLVRACTAQQLGPGPAREREIRYQVGERSFLWTAELCAALDEYEADRERYPDLAAFLPRIVETLEAGVQRIEARSRERERHLAHWQKAEPEVSEALVSEVERGLSEALRRIERTTDPDEARASLRGMEFERDVQVTVLDEEGNFVFHVGGLRGSAYGHRDLRGRRVYRDLQRSRKESGVHLNFDFLSQDAASARANVIAWSKLDVPGWLVCVEGHEWRRAPGAE